MSPWFSTWTTISEPSCTLQGRTWDRAVVAQHPHGCVAEPLGDRRDPQVELGTVGQLDHLGRCASGSPAVVCWEVVGSCSCGLLCRRSRVGSGGPAQRGAPGADLLGHVLGVVLDEAEQRRASGVLPGQAEEIQPGRLGYAALVRRPRPARRIPARRSRSGRGGTQWPRSRVRTSSLVSSRECHRRAGGIEGARVKLDAVATQRRVGWSRSTCLRWPAAAGRSGCPLSCGSVRSCRGTRTGRGRGCAAGGASAAIRSRYGPRARRKAPRRSGSRCCRRRPRAPLRRGCPRASGRRCCASARPRGLGPRRSVARTGSGTVRWRSRPGRPQYARSSSSTRYAAVGLRRTELTRLPSSTGRSKRRA